MASSYAALVSLMRVIHDLEHHPSPPISLDKQLVESITQRITYIEEFLHFYNISPPVADNDEEEDADPLEMRIAAAAHAAEDAIEYHIVDCINQKKNKKEAANDDDEKINSANRCFGILQSVIEEMDSIKKVLMVDIYTQKKKKAPVVYDQVATRNIIPPDEISLVGSDGVLLEIMEKLAGGQLDFQVIPIVGMGGIGKTFLAKTIYTKPLIKEHFDISAWATISQQYDTGEILRELLSQAKKEKLSGMSVDELGLELHKHLFSRRFLIVMDDMWSIDSWDNIQRFFPNNGNDSRVLVTTRISQLSLQLSNDDYSLRMSFLDEASSWELFSITVFGEESSCPPELEEIGEEIVDNCRGLPLSIAVVGGLLKNMDATRSSWESIRDNFTSMVNMENDKHCLRLLKLSYNHLPVYLKPCFLYMGMFDEDKRILVSTIVQLWISEGFLKLTNGESLEATARGFLQDLIDRNLILIDKLGSTGRLRFCKMHDLVRDMCLKEGQKQGFCHVIGQCNPPTQGINVERRVFIPEYTSKETVRGELRYLSRTRSILCERGEVLFCRDMLLLRTLQGKYHSVNSINKINLGFLVFRYVNLRHIAISAPQMFLFIPSVSRLWNLHTLIVSSSSLSEPILFFDFWKTPQLRHVEFDDFGVGLPDPPNGDAVVIMENLHTLKGIRNFKCSEEIVKRIPNIKRLSLEYCRADADDDIDDDDSDDGSYDDDDDEEEEEEDDDGDGNIGDGDNYVYHVGNMKNMLGVEFLSITFRSSSSTILRQNITFPHSLKKLSVSMGYDIEFGNMLEKFGSLPLLEKLKLTDGCFEKGEWEITEEQFPSLKYLKLFCCDGLENMSAKEQDSSILPRLENLVLVGLAELKRIPFELGNIDTLKSIKLIDCGEGAVESAKEMFDEQVDLQGGEDQLSFHVVVSVREDQEHLLSLAAPNFFVKIQFARL